MAVYRFHHLVEVRYGDLDPQGHVNNAAFLTYMEQARVSYVQHLGLWRGGSFLDFGLILADVHVSYRAPILFGAAVRVGMGTTHLGNKSFHTAYCLEPDAPGGQPYATGEAVMVMFDYRANRTVPIPENWRAVIAAYEGIPPHP
jgi:acyl-CoA thioester hydrolase